MNAPHFRLMATEAERLEVWELLCSYRLVRFNLHAWREPRAPDWLRFTANGDCDVWLADGWGVYYLTQGMGVTPLAHFAVWPQQRRAAETFLCAALAHGFRVYAFPAVLGLTPARFRHVFPLIRCCGFEVLGTIPGALSLWGRPEAGVLSIRRRQKGDDTWAE